MDALDLLRKEHSALLSEVYQMDKQLVNLESSGPIKGARVIRELVETSKRMRTDLQQHATKEERGFFSVLESKLGKDRDLVDVMRREHEELVDSLDLLISELDRMTIDRDTRKTWNLVSALQDFKEGLSDHLSKEERVLFWLAELRLSRLDQRKVASSIRAQNEACLPLEA